MPHMLNFACMQTFLKILKINLCIIELIKEVKRYPLQWYTRNMGKPHDLTISKFKKKDIPGVK